MYWLIHCVMPVAPLYFFYELPVCSWNFESCLLLFYQSVKFGIGDSNSWAVNEAMIEVRVAWGGGNSLERTTNETIRLFELKNSLEIITYSRQNYTKKEKISSSDFVDICRRENQNINRKAKKKDILMLVLSSLSVNFYFRIQVHLSKILLNIFLLVTSLPSLNDLLLSLFFWNSYKSIPEWLQIL